MTTLLSPRPAILDERISMKYGAGGRAMRALIEGVFLAGAAEAPNGNALDGNIAVGLSAARKLASVVRGRVAAGDDPQSEKRAKREAARRRRLGATVNGALATWLRDEKLGPLG